MSNVGELSYFLGLQIQLQQDSILLSQEKYARNSVEKFELKGATPMTTPMPTTGKLQSNPGEKSVDQKLYRSMIGSLLYLTATRPYIAFSVGCFARFQADPRESHLKAVKRIIRYVNGTIDYGLSYSMDTNNSLVAYSDNDWKGCVHEDFVDPVTEDEMYLIDLSSPSRELEVERQKNKEMAEENLYLECDKQEITYQRRGQTRTLINNIIFMKNIIDNNNDMIQLQPADVERLEDIANK
ncbi:uncharacterized protein LOC113290711 [Papaver somniferum]|uniref:uncharacterized protein LOC113290711 n=1 Tax=Papaver somniferum TaxID=3469 RepID=UPI000E6F8004|nr:uncharacterized protein LOC113290711 [Papaver somniferum]